MNKMKHSRYLAPVIVFGAGTVMAGAVAAGHTWADALITEVITIVLAAAYYALTASHSDIGDIYAQREDERQQLVLLRAQSLAWRVMILAAFVCALIAVAGNHNYWQADVIGSVGGFSFLFALLGYGAHDDSPSSDAEGVMAGRQHHDESPVSEESAGE
jgi:hypothetical protein